MTAPEDWIAGIHAVTAAVEGDAGRVAEILIDVGTRNPRLARLAKQARERGIPVCEVGAERLDALAQGLRHQGVVARCQARIELNEDDLLELLERAAGPPLLLVLDGVQDPHNLGACLRSAAAAGATAVVIPKNRSASINATVQRTSAGAAQRIPVARVTNLARTLEQLRKQGIWLVGLDGEAAQSLYAVDLSGPIGIVMGAEGQGLRRLTREHCDYLVAIPMPGAMESLNVSVATGIALFEAVRQRA